MMATQELVVPRSIPMILDMRYPFPAANPWGGFCSRRAGAAGPVVCYWQGSCQIPLGIGAVIGPRGGSGMAGGGEFLPKWQGGMTGRGARYFGGEGQAALAKGSRSE